ncbi:dihydroxyacetone kinase subunit DhaL [Levilactobacillus bambusae]|uniref:phosphoenolpyruvate--glycerone phosphotransferase n=1 Tax=Levilactobacillus bambusae TaxID=2024736 RepID=A0A2V1MXE1_9LACO|nr:dihydroxyacetone kinase subunit DhaL [Levilactobacillus bambusae]PWF99482.1 dihydroxyacetone kinase subunit L [Levilactobacillus bambusae]
MLTVETIAQWMNGWTKDIKANKGYLNELDSVIGDGDHGSNLARGADAIEAALLTAPDDVPSTFKAVAMAIVSKVGGASGALYGTAFLEMYKESQRTTDMVKILDKAMKAMEKRGDSKPGEKTMLDVWEPVVKAAKRGNVTPIVIDDAVESTKDMKATKGRASYVGEKSIGHLDPGAVSSGYLFHNLFEVGLVG